MREAVNVKDSGLIRGLIAGCLTGAIEVCITYPTELIKTKLQLSDKRLKVKYSGVIDCFKRTVRKHGYLGLYRGLNVMLYGTMPKTSIRFGAYESIKNLNVDEHGHLSTPAKIYCGLFAGLTEAILIVTPMETIKIRFINDMFGNTRQYQSFFDGVSHMIKEEGFRGIYKGLTATMLKQGINQTIRFSLIEILNDSYTGGNIDIQVPTWYYGFSGAVAGGASVLVNTPIDVVKTRMQGLEANNYKNTWVCAVKLYEDNGLKGFYKGFVPRLFRSTMDVSLTFMIYRCFINFFAYVYPP